MSSNPASSAVSTAKDKNPAKKAPSLRKSSKEMVCVTVGKGQEEFHVHKAFLCQYSPYFDRALNGKFIEAKTQTVNLTEENADAFGVFVDWIYTQKIDNYPTIGDTAAPTELFIKVWCLADYFQVPILQNLAADAIMESVEQNPGNGLPLSSLHLLYKLTCHDSLLRKLFVHMFSTAAHHTLYEKYPEDFPHQMLVDLMISVTRKDESLVHPIFGRGAAGKYHVPTDCDRSPSKNPS